MAIDVRGLQTAEGVAPTTGRMGLADEFSGLASIARTVAGGAEVALAGVASRRKAQQEAQDNAVLAGSLRGALETGAAQAQAELEANLTAEDIEFLQSNASLKERFSLANKRSVGSTYRKMLENRKLIEQVDNAPHLRDELISIYKVGSDAGAKLQSELDQYDKPIREAANEALKEMTTVIARHTPIPAEELRNWTPLQIENYYEESGLGPRERQYANLDIKVQLQERGNELTEANSVAALNDWEKANPGVVQTMALRASGQLLERIRDGYRSGELDATSAKQLAAATKQRMLEDLADKTGLPQSVLQEHYTSLLSEVDKIGTYDPNKEGAAAIENSRKLYMQQAINGRFTTDEDFRATQVAIEALGPLMSSPEAASQFSSLYLDVAAKASSGDGYFDLGQLDTVITSNPASAARFSVEALQPEATQDPALRIGLDKAIGKVLAAPLEEEAADRYYTQLMPALADPGMADRWRRAASTRRGRRELAGAAENLSGFINRNLSELTSQAPNDQFSVTKDGLLSSNSKSAATQAWLANINNSVKAIAHMEGHVDYFKILEQVEVDE